MDIQKIIVTDKDIMGGQAVFYGTRVPVESLFDYLEAGVSVDEFLEEFPSVTREQTITILDMANKMLTSKNVAELYEAVA